MQGKDCPYGLDRGKPQLLPYVEVLQVWGVQLRITTKYPKSIRDGYDRLFKPASNNGKVGGSGNKITKGRWKGFAVYSLTLTERDTCPSTCYHWDDCYGNNMPFAHRFRAGPELEKAIPDQLEALSKKHPNGFVIRLHILGDFYSVPYVRLWSDQLIRFPNMRIWGYSARVSGDPIYKELWLTRIRFSERFWMRFSHSKSYDSIEPFTIYSGNDKSDYDSIICPEQLDKTKSCLTCGLCWTINKSIKFITH